MGLIDELSAAARRWKHVRGAGVDAAPDHDEFRRSWVRLLGAKRDLNFSFVDLPAQRPPWTDTGIVLAPGEEVTLIAYGRTYLSKALDVWVGAQFQLWARVGDNGGIFNGTRATNSFSAGDGGRLYLANGFPGQWGDPTGRVSSDLRAYAKTSGGLSVFIVRWKSGAADGLATLQGQAEANGQRELAAELAAEAQRLANPPAPPEGWNYLWFLGASDIYADGEGSEQGCITCSTEANVGILQKDVALALTPDTRLLWDWKVDALPSDVAENATVAHDYLSIAVEFNDGRDITYHWSRQLKAETGYWCPLDGWKDREYHVVIRSGGEGLGAWMSESRNLFEDYRRHMGTPPARIVRVWLIANSLFQRRRGQCAYRNIRLSTGSAETAVS